MSTITQFLKEQLGNSIEPQAYLVGQRANDDISVITAVSAAVSLKRIAEALEIIASPPSVGSKITPEVAAAEDTSSSGLTSRLERWRKRI
jgi:hypothetical protein